MKIVYDKIDYNSFLQDVAKQTKGVFNGATFHFPTLIADGTLRFVKLPGGLQLLLSDYKANCDIEYLRLKGEEESYILRIYYAELLGESYFVIDGKEIRIPSDLYANMMMTSTRFNFGAVVKKDTIVKSANVLFNKAWANKYFSANTVTYWLNHFYTIRLNGLNRVALDYHARDLLMALLNAPLENPSSLIFSQARIFELTDYYINQIIRQEKIYPTKEILANDIAKIVELDVRVNESIKNKMHLPTINEMAAATKMSPTKLKSLFKKIYKKTITAYFNSCRLCAARQSLLNSDISIKELSTQFAYKSVQHFTTAFKKEFGKTPAALIKSFAS